MKTIQITTSRGIKAVVASWQNGKLGFYRRYPDGLASEYPPLECTLKQALRHIEGCYNTPFEKVQASAQ